MILSILSLTLASFVISWVLTFIVRRVAIRVGFTDKPGHRKIHSKPIALGGGIAIFLAFALPMLGGLALVRWSDSPSFHFAGIQVTDAGTGATTNYGGGSSWQIPTAYWTGAREQTPLALSFLAACLVLHL